MIGKKPDRQLQVVIDRSIWSQAGQTGEQIMANHFGPAWHNNSRFLRGSRFEAARTGVRGAGATRSFRFAATPRGDQKLRSKARGSRRAGGLGLVAPLRLELLATRGTNHLLA